MANDDRAIVIGVQSYPGFDRPNDPSRRPLVSPDVDAHAFCDWLVDPNGGALLPDRVKLIVTSNWPLPFPAVRDARPTEELVREAFEDLQDEAETAPRGRLGRRLYIYMAGHGIAPGENQTALLMANANYDQRRYGTGYHVIGEYVAGWVADAHYFDEILLFMDCCREIQAVPAPNMPWGPLRDSSAPETVKRFYAFAARFQRVSWEAPAADGQTHGVFSHALLTGLRGAARDRESNDITTESLWNYLYTNMKSFLPAELQDAPNIPKTPDRGRADNFVIVKAPPVPTYPVTIHLPANSAGKKVTLAVWVKGALQELDSIVAAGPAWPLSLPVGGYRVSIPDDNLKQLFEVTGAGGTDVQF
jgi:hypothetical protein